MYMKPTRSSLDTLMALFEVLSHDLSPTARCKHIHMFLRIVSHEGASISELHRLHPKGSLSSTFKLVRELSARSWRKQEKKSLTQKRIPGLGLVRLEPDEHDERIQRVYLSKKGQHLAQKLIKTL